MVRQHNEAVEAQREVKQFSERLEAAHSRTESEARQRRFRDAIEAEKTGH